MHDYLVEYISEKIQEFIRIDKEEMNLLNKSMDIYKNRLKSTLENFESIFSTEVGQKQIFQERYFGQYISLICLAVACCIHILLSASHCTCCLPVKAISTEDPAHFGMCIKIHL